MGRPSQPRAARRRAHPPRPAPSPPVARPRYGRIAAAAGSLVVTLVATLGGTGVLPTASSDAAAAPRPVAVQAAQHVDAPAARTTPTDTRVKSEYVDGRQLPSAKPVDDRTANQLLAIPVPADSGTGRRIVFDITAQRVWLVDRVAGRDVVVRTYLVSGSVTDNLQPGTYAVYSRSLHATGVDDSGSMMYMVRFTHGPNAPIGFHDIPVLDGHQLQTRTQLGSPQSHGCIRQARPDARALWAFAPIGTKVVVV